jgi:hypothetical protein
MIVSGVTNLVKAGQGLKLALPRQAGIMPIRLPAILMHVAARQRPVATSFGISSEARNRKWRAAMDDENLRVGKDT